MLKCFLQRPLRLVLTLTLLSVVAQAQNSTNPITPQVKIASASQINAALSALPEADTLIYINPQRILNEVAPKVLPEADVAKMRQQFSDLKHSAGVDPSSIDFLVVAVRFRKPAADLSFQAPEFLVVGSGDFSAESLLTLARLGLQEKAREEKYGSKTLSVTTIDDIAKEAEKNPFLKSFTEIGLVSLNTNTIASGNVPYIKAAIDAMEGRDRISQNTLNSLLRDTNALISIAGSPWTSLGKSFGLMGLDGAPRTSRCESRLGEFYASVTMEGNNFKLNGALNADNPDTAKIVNNLLSGLMKNMQSEGPEAKSFPSFLKMVNLSARESEILLQAEFPMQMVADFVREQMKPKTKDEAKSSAAPASAPSKKPRRVIRRRRSGT
jgi:hypothetical protein